MNKKFRKAASVALAAMMCMAMTAHVNADYAMDTTNSTTSTDYDKNLVMSADAVVPNVEFTFTVTPGDSVPADEGVFPVFAGIMNGLKLTSETGNETTNVDNSSVSINVKFGANNNNDTTKGGTPTDANDNTKKYATDKVTLDFSGVVFDKPGVYRYIITETASTAVGITDDENLVRYLDVYVEDATGIDGKLKLIIADYVLSADAKKITTNDNQGTKEYEDGNKKSEGFTNEYASYALTVGKTVEGNQGNKDQYFDFNVSIENATPGEYTVTYDPTSKHEKNPETIIVEDDGTFSGTFKLKHGESFTIVDLSAGAKWTVTEDKEDYLASVQVTEGKDVSDALTDGNTANDKTTGIRGDTTVAFTNKRSGTVPTGILMTVAPFAGLMVVGIAGAAVILNKKKKDD